MPIGVMVYEAIRDKNPDMFLVMSDWIQDHCPDHPEIEVYLHRLRSPKVSFRTAVDTVLKFGDRQERKLFARIDRLIMRMRHRPSGSPKKVELFSLQGRKEINKATSFPLGYRRRKKPLLVREKKREATGHDVWFIGAFRAFLQPYYGGG